MQLHNVLPFKWYTMRLLHYAHKHNNDWQFATVWDRNNQSFVLNKRTEFVDCICGINLGKGLNCVTFMQNLITVLLYISNILSPHVTFAAFSFANSGKKRYKNNTTAIIFTLLALLMRKH